MPQQNDLSRSLTPFEHTTTLVAVSWQSQETDEANMRRGHYQLPVMSR